MRILVTGANGQLGRDVLHELIKRGHNCVGSGRAPEFNGNAAEYAAMDITDAARVTEILNTVGPDAVIHCAAWTDVDGAEAKEKTPKVYAVNGGGTWNIAGACKTLDCKMMYISTDYVFDGQGTNPWKPEQKPRSPLNVYGGSKLAGELAVKRTLEKYFIVRTAWAFGQHGKNFVNTILDLGMTHDEIRVVNDQIGTPTYTVELARLLADMIETEKYGIYHATNEGGYISWYDFACEIYRQASLTTKVIPVTTAEYGVLKAARPLNGRLDRSKLREMGFVPLPNWRDALARYLKIKEGIPKC